MIGCNDSDWEKRALNGVSFSSDRTDSRHLLFSKAQTEKRRSMPKQCLLGSVLSYGSEGTVHSGAWQDRIAAIKVLTNQYARRAENEAKLVMNLNHPNIIKYYGLEYEQKSAYLSMELITGGNLYDFIRGKFTSTDYWTVIEQVLKDVARGMAYLHAYQIVQGDLKSHNILLREETYQAVICDFGIAKSLNDEIPQERKRSNTTKGTIRWMAPEICAPPPEASSFASDVWAYGCVILEVTSGLEPWAEQYADDSLLFRALQRRENASMFARICENQTGPTHLRQLLMQCCSWSKFDRPRFTNILQRLGDAEQPSPPPRRASIDDNDDVTMQEPASPSPLPSIAENQFFQPKSHGGRLTGEVYTSTGSASGRPIYEGVKGGRYYLTDRGKKVYLHK